MTSRRRDQTRPEPRPGPFGALWSRWRDLTAPEPQVVGILAAERDERRDRAAALRARGRSEADDLDGRAAVLSAHLTSPEPPPPGLLAAGAVTTDEPGPDPTSDPT